MAGVGGTIYINEVDADSMRHPQNRDNIEAINCISHAMLQATRMISQVIGQAQPPAATTVIAPIPNTTTRPLPPGGDGDVLGARAANRTDTVVHYERMIDCLEQKEEEELEACLNAPA